MYINIQLRGRREWETESDDGRSEKIQHIKVGAPTESHSIVLLSHPPECFKI